ncbi:MAG: class I SAM-dependent methyltransferase [Deltaproteobacteria bacterium]|nr:class I SAM-dependent methyltransferase [Deltaproteobacteria bacterium]
MRPYWEQRHRAVHGLRAVANLDRSEAENAKEYEVARARLAALIRQDFEAAAALSVLDVGFGQGHDAEVLQRLGVQDYTGLDFASPRPSGFPPGYRFLRQDIAAADLEVEGGFSLVLLLDVAFHVVDDDAFARMVANVRRHATDRIYVTGLFRDLPLAPHVRHRPLSAFAELGTPIDLQPWRDTHLLRIKV